MHTQENGEIAASFARNDPLATKCPAGAASRRLQRTRSRCPGDRAEGAMAAFAE